MSRSSRDGELVNLDHEQENIHNQSEDTDEQQLEQDQNERKCQDNCKQVIHENTKLEQIHSDVEHFENGKESRYFQVVSFLIFILFTLCTCLCDVCP